MLIAETLVDENQRIASARQREKPLRSLAKAISWRITGSLDTMVISWFFTDSLETAMAIGFTEVLTKTILYYFHERAWNRVSVGIQH